MRSRSSFLLCGVLLVAAGLVEAGLGYNHKEDYGHEKDYDQKEDYGHDKKDGNEYQEEKYLNQHPATHTDSYPTAQQILRANGGLIQPFQLGNQHYPALPQHYAGLPQHYAGFPQHYPTLPRYNPGLPQYNPVLPQNYPAFPQYYPALPHIPHVPEHYTDNSKHFEPVKGRHQTRKEYPDEEAKNRDERLAIPFVVAVGGGGGGGDKHDAGLNIAVRPPRPIPNPLIPPPLPLIVFGRNANLPNNVIVTQANKSG